MKPITEDYFIENAAILQFDLLGPVMRKDPPPRPWNQRRVLLLVIVFAHCFLFVTPCASK